ncbi:hypothetical protein ABKN59_003132 [Abortiporus biennis]
MSDSESQSKKADTSEVDVKVEATEPQSPSDDDCPFKKCHDLWFDDGNIVLIAHDLHFRVHRSILSYHSVFFKDMFGLPQPPTSSAGSLSEGANAAAGHDSENIEGCPVVRMTDDHTELTHYLKAMYDGRRYFGKDATLSFDAIVGLIRLGHKFQSPDFQKDALSLIENRALWINGEFIPGWKPAYCIIVANLASQIDNHDLLSNALYACCQLDSDTLLDGVNKPNNSGVEVLSSSLLKMCLSGRNNLAIVQINIMERAEECLDQFCIPPKVVEGVEGSSLSSPVTSSPSQSKPTSPNCKAQVTTAWRHPCPTTVVTKDFSTVWHPLARINIWFNSANSLSICKTCKSSISKYRSDCANMVWDNLPRYFGLGEEKGEVSLPRVYR